MITIKSLSEKKLDKAQQSLLKAMDNMKSGNKRLAVGDIHYILDRTYEALYLLEAEIEEGSE